MKVNHSPKAKPALKATPATLKHYCSDEARWHALQQRARQADGVFFYAVTTTGIFCRPSCASRMPKRTNVRFFNTLEQAQAAGFRPCLRCHPLLLNNIKTNP